MRNPVPRERVPRISILDNVKQHVVCGASTFFQLVAITPTELPGYDLRLANLVSDHFASSYPSLPADSFFNLQLNLAGSYGVFIIHACQASIIQEQLS